MTARLDRVLVAHARNCFQSQKHLSENWRPFGFAYEPDFDDACDESDGFIGVLERFGAKVEVLPKELCTGLDSLYVHDPVVTVDGGFVTVRMGKDLRKNEPQSIGKFLQDNDLKVTDFEAAGALLEGGDIVWLNPDLPAVGEGYRSNAEGIAELKRICGDSIQEVIPVSLPHWNGPADILHLMSMVSPLAHRKLLVYSRLLPVTFRNMLLDMEFELLEVPEDEYDSMGCNVLALDENTCLIEEGNVKTAALLSSSGFEVLTYSGKQISLAGGGGPTCLTRPLWRSS
jgi:N-dimethylarginine dimethylaminohydrolase